MEVQIQELIDKIKSQGIEKAEKASGDMLKDAERKAAAIVSDAKKEAERIILDAKDEASKFEVTGKQAVSQAGRDLILNVKSSLSKIFDTVVGGEFKGAMGKDFLESTLVKVVKAWVDKGAMDVEILLSAEDQKKLSDYLNKKLSAELKKGVEIKTSPSVAAGFKIAEKDGGAFYDITDQGIADGLKPFLNEKLSACIDDALK